MEKLLILIFLLNWFSIMLSGLAFTRRSVICYTLMCICFGFSTYFTSTLIR